MNEKNKMNPILKEILDYVLLILVVFVIVLFLNNVILLNARIPSQSMENTIMMGDRIFGSRLTYRFHDPERYDIVIFKYPDDESQLFIKRIIGLPGDTVTITEGKVYINDDPMPLEDDFIAEPMEGDFGPYEVPQGQYFMMGDNRNYSLDSRFWTNTFVAKDKILAKAYLRYWPLDSIGMVQE